MPGEREGEMTGGQRVRGGERECVFERKSNENELLSDSLTPAQSHVGRAPARLTFRWETYEK